MTRWTAGKMLVVAGQTALALLIVWLAGAFVSFGIGVLGATVGLPSWLPLPWSDVRDFVETTDGTLLVATDFYARVQSYDRSGRFRASHCRPDRPIQRHRLATDRHGNVYVAAPGGICVLSSSWELLDRVEAAGGPGYWRLDADGEPDFVTTETWQDAMPAANRLAEPGDCLFYAGRARDTFTCADGTTLIRRGNALERRDAEGSIVYIYRSALWLRPFAFPWPGFLAWPVALLMGYVATRRKRLPGGTPESVPARKVVVDACVTVGVVVAAGGALLVGSMLVVAVANALPDTNPLGFWLVPLVLLPCWYLLIRVSFAAWRVLMEKVHGGPFPRAGPDRTADSGSA